MAVGHQPVGHISAGRGSLVGARLLIRLDDDEGHRKEGGYDTELQKGELNEQIHGCVGVAEREMEDGGRDQWQKSLKTRRKTRRAF